MSRVDTKDAAHTLGLSDAGKILEIDKARTAMVQQAWTSGASGGYFTLTVNGNTTGHLNYNADHDAVEDALELLLNIGAGNVEVTGPGTGSGNPFVISYDAALGDVGTISIDISHLTGTTPAGAAGTTTAAVTTVTLTIPSFETAAFPQGTRIELVQAGACQIAVSGPSDGTLFCADEPKTATLWSGAILYKRTAGDDPNDWVLIGDLAAA